MSHGTYRSPPEVKDARPSASFGGPLGGGFGLGGGGNGTFGGPGLSSLSGAGSVSASFPTSSGSVGVFAGRSGPMFGPRADTTIGARFGYNFH
jgi:hypothetical protein